MTRRRYDSTADERVTFAPRRQHRRYLPPIGGCPFLADVAPEQAAAALRAVLT
ncbi:hypothetical protein [Frankia sp. R82]|uniref:hypothetical protein n=1 Tax=Frankia sp. R82 TaxID=2950553 RepID=UPI0020431171|nr:hypothetical protein [Frankia sp. R82]MCM3883398.1 hypothetical protein [Frankia sp. R82]